MGHSRGKSIIKIRNGENNMQKIISLFKRDYDGDRGVINEIVPGAEWVLNGEGVATEKIDGTCCLIHNGTLYKRYDHKPDNWKAIQRALKYGGVIPSPIMSPAPDNFEPAQEPDPITLHWPGWMPVSDTPEDKWHLEAFGSGLGYEDGTYELIGPKIQGNPYNLLRHVLSRHGVRSLGNPPRDYEGLKVWFVKNDIEGIVWHHSDGRMVKIKRRDFGYKWPEK